MSMTWAKKLVLLGNVGHDFGGWKYELVSKNISKTSEKISNI